MGTIYFSLSEGLKMQEWQYKHVGYLDPNTALSFKEKVQAFTKEEWSEFKGKKIFKSQPESESIILKAVEDSTSPVYRGAGVDNKYLQNLFSKELNEIYKKIDETFQEKDHVALRVQLVKLPARKNVLPHIDVGHIFRVTRRIHLPIITNQNVDFFIELEKVPMEEGRLIEINNQAIHCVFNQSDLDRVHLIIDWGYKDYKN
jgi:hypothetical protein